MISVAAKNQNETRQNMFYIKAIFKIWMVDVMATKKS